MHAIPHKHFEGFDLDGDCAVPVGLPVLATIRASVALGARWAGRPVHFAWLIVERRRGIHGGLAYGSKRRSGRARVGGEDEARITLYVRCVGAAVICMPFSRGNARASA
jgi:hypothetical protein